MTDYERNSIKAIHCTDDFIRLNIHVGETVKYNGKYYTFSGISGYEADNRNPLNLLREIPQESVFTGDPYVGKRFDFRGYEVEILQQNKNGSYSAQAYKNGKKYSGRFPIMKPELSILKPLEAE